MDHALTLHSITQYTYQSTDVVQFCVCVRACIVEDSELSLCGILVGFLFYVHFNRFLPRDAMHVCVCVCHKSEFY